MTEEKTIDEQLELPVVDEQRLLRILCHSFNQRPMKFTFNNWRQRFAARVITDSVRLFGPEEAIDVETAMINATSWIDRAYERGRDEGARQERQRLGRNICKVFGIDWKGL